RTEERTRTTLVTASALSPTAVASVAVASRASWRRPARTTAYPARASASAAALPIPDPAPVTMATLSGIDRPPLDCCSGMVEHGDAMRQAVSFLTRLRSFFSPLVMFAIRSLSMQREVRELTPRSPILNEAIIVPSPTFRSFSNTLHSEQPPILTSHDVLDGLQPLAGGIIWRRARLSEPEVLLVRHVRTRGWGFPKGKLERGETARQAALREAREETGLRCRCEA